MSMSRYDLPATDFPFTIEFLNADGEVVHTISVTGPGGFYVPPLSKEHGPVGVRTTYGDGRIEYMPPPT